MYDFVSHVLRQYFHATGWNEHNSYLNLTASSAALLDFPTPSGLSFSISAAPSPCFFTSYRLAALPDLRGGIGYIYTSTDHPLDIGSSSRDVRFKEIVERFRITEAPRRPLGKEPTWQGGRRVDTRDYMIYGCMHVPSSRLDALYTVRISPTWQLLLTAVSTPPKYPLSALASRASGSGLMSSASERGLDSSNPNLAATAIAPTTAASAAAAAAASAAAAATSSTAFGAGPPGSTNLQLTLQNDTGRWFTEYSYSADDALWGFRVLHNFGTPSGSPADPSSALQLDPPTPQTGGAPVAVASPSNLEPVDSPSTPSGPRSTAQKRRINESGLSDASDPESAVGGGLRGRFSAGAEVFVSTVEKSAGLSTGIRFATLPEPTGPLSAGGPPSQPPTVLTATLNPMMGHLSSAYAARMARDLVVCSRFDFNVYSYDSELSLGAEYWLRAAPSPSAVSTPSDLPIKGGSTTTTTYREARRSRRAEEAIIEAETAAAEMQPPRPTSLRVNDPHGTATATQHRSDGPDDKVAPSPSPSPSLSIREPRDTLDAPPAAVPPSSLVQPPSIPASPSLPPSTQPPGSILASYLPPITGVLKARLSTASDIRLLWQGRLRNCLVSLGVRADLNAAGGALPLKPPAGTGIVQSVGIEVMYFSSAAEATA